MNIYTKPHIVDSKVYDKPLRKSEPDKAQRSQSVVLCSSAGSGAEAALSQRIFLYEGLRDAHSRSINMFIPKEKEVNCFRVFNTFSCTALRDNVEVSFKQSPCRI